VTDKG
jgi:hypothetical protein